MSIQIKESIHGYEIKVSSTDAIDVEPQFCLYSESFEESHKAISFNRKEATKLMATLAQFLIHGRVID